MSTLKIVSNDRIVASDSPLPITIIGGVPASAITGTIPASGVGSGYPASSIGGASGYFANTALSNLSSVGINTSLVSDTAATDSLGSTTKPWLATHLDGGTVADEGTVYFNGGTTLFIRSVNT